jgi:ketosteroid isomerase-like protein
MPGPNPPDPHLGAAGPPFADSHPSEPIPASLRYGPPVEAAPPAAAYPGPLPPPVRYPKRSRRRLIVGALVALLLAGGLTAAILYRSQGKPAAPAGAFSDATATSAIQGYLDALEHRDIETIARNTLCGIYDAVRDRRSDQALAKLSSDAFRKQFSTAKVTSIDKIVYWSNYQAQVLFSMTVESASGGGPRNQVQGVAQLLMQKNQILVCSYVLRTAGTY